MNDINNVKVSRFPQVFSKNEVLVSLKDELIKIKDGTHKNTIDPCREAKLKGNDSTYNYLKSKLPCILFCGQFVGGQANDNLTYYNNLIIIDIDKLETSFLNDLVIKLKNDKYILAVFLSPSGLGLKALIKNDIPVLFHKHLFRSLEEYFLTNYGVAIDPSGSNVNRPCYISHDPDLFLNENSEVYHLDVSKISLKTPIRKSVNKSTYNVDKSNLRHSYGLNKATDRILMKNIITYLRKNGKSITYTHEKWYKCAFAMTKVFSYDVGQKYYLSLCELDGQKFDREGSMDKILYCYENSKLEDSVGFGTIIFYAEGQGFVVPKRLKAKKEQLLGNEVDSSKITAD